jgi:hypothetical protein
MAKTILKYLFMSISSRYNMAVSNNKLTRAIPYNRKISGGGICLAFTKRKINSGKRIIQYVMM